MDEIMTPTDARKNFYTLLKNVNKNHKPITISSIKNKDDAVIMSKDDYNALMETLYLENTGVGQIVREREKDDSGFTNIEDIDWDNL